MNRPHRPAPSLLVRFPWLTLLATALAGAALAFPAWSITWQFDRAAIAAGEVWRLASGHLTHWNFDHLLWDAAMFALLAALVERRSRALLAGTLLLSSAAISATLWFGSTELATYRGLSGVDSALFTTLAVLFWGDALRANRQLVAAAIAATLGGFAAKIGYETATGATLFVDSAAAGFVPLPLVHAVGGVCGALAGWRGS